MITQKNLQPKGFFGLLDSVYKTWRHFFVPYQAVRMYKVLKGVWKLNGRKVLFVWLYCQPIFLSGSANNSIWQVFFCLPPLSMFFLFLLLSHFYYSTFRTNKVMVMFIKQKKLREKLLLQICSFVFC
jgi:hypothetical protein